MQHRRRSVKRAMLDHRRRCRFSKCVADTRCLYLQLRRILTEMTDALFSSWWRILEPHDCANLDWRAKRRTRHPHATISATALQVFDEFRDVFKTSFCVEFQLPYRISRGKTVVRSGRCTSPLTTEPLQTSTR